MADDAMYHEGSRQLQDRFGSRRIADRLEQVTLHTAFTADDRAFIEGCAMFFLATVDAEGRPDCSYKGGMPGFVRVLDEQTLAFPDYDGNGMFRSMGNILVNPHIGLLFVDFEHPNRVRVNGLAALPHRQELVNLSDLLSECGEVVLITVEEVGVSLWCDEVRRDQVAVVRGCAETANAEGLVVVEKR